MLDGAALRSVVEREKPHLIVPEIEPVATLALIEREGYRERNSNNVDRAVIEPDIALGFFGTPQVRGHGRMGVSLALGSSIDEARAKARAMTQIITVSAECG
jgi:phosphoribosylglycinamide formyltransferase 2